MKKIVFIHIIIIIAISCLAQGENNSAELYRKKQHEIINFQTEISLDSLKIDSNHFEKLLIQQPNSYMFHDQAKVLLKPLGIYGYNISFNNSVSDQKLYNHKTLFDVVSSFNHSDFIDQYNNIEDKPLYIIGGLIIYTIDMILGIPYSDYGFHDEFDIHNNQLRY